MSFGEQPAKPARGAKAERAANPRTVADLVDGEIFTFAEAPMITILPAPRPGESDRDYVRRVMPGRGRPEVVHRRSGYIRAVLSHHGGGVPFVRFINDDGKVSQNAYSVSDRLVVTSPPAPPVRVVDDLAESLGGRP